MQPCSSHIFPVAARILLYPTVQPSGLNIVLIELFHITLYRNTQSSLGPGFVSRYVNSRTSFLIRVHTSRGTVPLKRQPPKPVHNTSRGTVPLKRQPPKPVSQYSEQKLN